MNQDIKHIIESLLFVSETPLSIRRMAEVLDLDDLAAVRNAVRRLSDEYDRRKGGFYLSEVAGGYQLRTRPEHKAWIQRMLQSGPSRLSRAAMETLAIVAYRQPVLRSDVEHIRGVDCGGVLRALLERKIIKILGRKEMPGRPLLYGTTRKFLEIFNLKDLKDLPTPKELAPEKSGTSDAPATDGSPFPEAPKEITDEAPGETPERQPDEAEGPEAPTTEDISPDPESSENLPVEYLPMVIEEDLPNWDPETDAQPSPNIDSDLDTGSDSDPAQPAGDGTPEKNT